MSYIYVNFYKTHGIRQSSHLVTPRLFKDSDFEFPINSLTHFIAYDEDTIGPDDSIVYYRKHDGPITIDHVDTLRSLLGQPKKAHMLDMSRIKRYQSNHKFFKYIKAPWLNVKVVKQLVVMNYAYLNELYRYTVQPISTYYRETNIQKTVIDYAKQIADESPRHQFIFIDVPDILPSMMTLNMFMNKTTPQIVKLLDTPSKLWLLEFWKWFEDNPSIPSVFSKLSRQQLAKLNIVFTYKGHWALLNMGILKGYFMSEKDNKTVDDTGIYFQPKQMQKNFLRMMMYIQSSGVVASVDAPIETTGPEESTDTELTEVPRVPVGQPQTPVETPPEETLNVDQDEDLKLLETIEKKTLMSKGVDAEGEEVETSSIDISSPTTPDEQQSLHDEIHADGSDTDVLKQQIDQYAEYGLMSASDYKSYVKQADSFNNAPNPYKVGKDSIQDFINIKEEDLKINPEDTKLKDSMLVHDKSMCGSTIKALDTRYINDIFKKNVVSMVSAVQRTGVVIQDYTIDDVNSIVGDYEIHTVKLKPIDGAASIARFRLPKLTEEGDFYASGIKYRMRKQRTDKPIRKIKPHVVALSSYYGKVFVQRSEKKTYDNFYWIQNQLLGIAYSGLESHITKVAPANVFDNYFKAPRVYSGMAHYFRSFMVDNNYFIFDHLEREKLYTPEALKKVEGSHRVVVGMQTVKENVRYPIVVDYDDQFYVVAPEADIHLGSIYTILDLNQAKAPIDYIELMVLGKGIPAGVVLGYLMGLSKVCKLLNATPRIVEGKTRATTQPHEWVLSFKDKKLIFSRKNALATLVLGGLASYKNELKNYNYENFDHPNVYLNILMSSKLNARYIRELDLLNDLFVDPITKQILIDMKEPTTFKGLVVRASELLILDQHPDSQDMSQMRIRGCERMAGAIYREMVRSIKDYKNRNIRGKSKIDLNPFAVWSNITRDPSVGIPQDINPLAYLRETESVTYGGEGGRDKGAMVKTSRAYHPSDRGVISEATSDSSDVGFNTYLTANPKITSVYGVIDPGYDPVKDGFTSMVSTPFLLSPGASTDSASRANMISIQQMHTVFCDGYHPPSVRTGYESIVAQRTGGMFSQQAKMDGKVIKKTDNTILVEYSDGSQVGYAIGRQYGHAEGSIYPQDVTTSLKEGSSVKKGDIITYNSLYFQPDPLSPQSVTWKSSLDVKVAFYESTQTLEDSCSISQKLSQKFKTRTTKVKSYVVKFTQGIKQLMKPGTQLKPTDILFIIEDEVTNEAGLFDEDTLKTLKKFSNFAPKSKVYGVLDKIEVFYHGNKDDMSPDLRKIADQSDKQLSDLYKGLGRKPITGSVNDEYRVEGNPLVLDTAEIKLYITVENTAGVGDKLVFANQLKSVIGEVMQNDMATDKGEPIDAVFGYRSAAARTVNSPLIIGTTSTLLKVIAQRAVSLYKGS